LLRSLGTLLREQPVLRQRAFYQGCMFATFSLKVAGRELGGVAASLLSLVILSSPPLL